MPALKVKHLVPTWVPPLPQVEAAEHWDGLAAEQVTGEHFQKARKPQLTLKNKVKKSLSDHQKYVFNK